MALNLFLWGYVNGIVYKTPVASFDQLKLRNFVEIKRVTSQMLELRVLKSVHVEIV
jgi:hypothetical protein